MLQKCLTIFTVILTKIIVEHKVLDALLFLTLRLLLASHSNRKVGVGGQLQRSSLDRISLHPCIGDRGIDLLLVSLLREYRKRHFRSRSRSLRVTVALVSEYSSLTRPRSDWQRHVEYGTSIELPGFQTIGHHLCVFAFEVGIFLGVDFFFLASYDDSLVNRLFRSRLPILVLFGKLRISRHVARYRGAQTCLVVFLIIFIIRCYTLVLVDFSFIIVIDVCHFIFR